jgi:hypothetical protein
MVHRVDISNTIPGRVNYNLLNSEIVIVLKNEGCWG